VVAADEWWNELKRRRERMREITAGNDCDAFLAFGAHGHAEHFRYLTNFAPALGDAWLVAAGDALVCVLDFD
jgi:hypothetical protein